jgi:hypothetical protein
MQKHDNRSLKISGIFNQLLTNAVILLGYLVLVRGLILDAIFFNYGNKVKVTSKSSHILSMSSMLKNITYVLYEIYYILDSH